MVCTIVSFFLFIVAVFSFITLSFSRVLFWVSTPNMLVLILWKCRYWKNSGAQNILIEVVVWPTNILQNVRYWGHPYWVFSKNPCKIRGKCRPKQHQYSQNGGKIQKVSSKKKHHLFCCKNNLDRCDRKTRKRFSRDPPLRYNWNQITKIITLKN